MRDVIEILSLLELLYNHLYLAVSAGGQQETSYENSRGKWAETSDPVAAVPDEDRLCLAQIEIDPPAFVEIVGATGILHIIYDSLAKGQERRDQFDDVLANLNFSNGGIRDVVSSRVRTVLEQLHGSCGVSLYEENDFSERQGREFH